SNQKLLTQGRLASIVIVGLGLIFSFNITNINDIWGWLTLGLGTGLFIPLVLRWYWWRFNGYGFAIGTGAGLVAAILTKGVILPVVNNSQIQEYVLFLVPSICSFLGCILGTFLTPATNLETINNFYRVTRPFGFWGVVRKQLPTNIQAKIQAENRRDIMGALIATPWQLVLFLMGIMLMMKQWDNFGILLLIFILLSIGLYFTWFRYLDKI
ncbi:MAG: sodium:solute symporter, partial [Okeania sp. SIO2D1]|nr:sodium:solute symporter [Okeania sp. SIO2D1]